MSLRRYIATLSTGRLILWCYFIWYAVVLVRYFDPALRLWLTSCGLSAIIGFALYLSTGWLRHNQGEIRSLAIVPPVPDAVLRFQLRRTGEGQGLHPDFFTKTRGKSAGGGGVCAALPGCVCVEETILISNNAADTLALRLCFCQHRAEVISSHREPAI